MTPAQIVAGFRRRAMASELENWRRVSNEHGCLRSALDAETRRAQDAESSAYWWQDMAEQARSDTGAEFALTKDGALYRIADPVPEPFSTYPAPELVIADLPELVDV